MKMEQFYIFHKIILIFQCIFNLINIKALQDIR